MRMKKLLTFLTLLTLFFGVSWAAEQHVTLSWAGNGDSDSNSKLTTSNVLSSDGFYDGDENIATCVTANYLYAGKAGKGLKVGASSSQGELEVTIQPSLKPTRVVFKVSAYSETKDVTVYAKLNSGTAENLLTKSTNVTLTDVELEMDGNTTLTRVYVHSSRYAYLKSITIYYDDEGGDDPTPTTYSLILPTGLTGGTVTATGASDLTKIPSGTRMTVTATPSDDTYELNWMKANDTEITSPYTFNITENTTITAAFKEKSTTPTGDYLFYESFDKCASTGGNDGSWSGSIASSEIQESQLDNSGWTKSKTNTSSNTEPKVYAANKCVKVHQNTIYTTPSINVTSGLTYTLTFKAAAWNASSESTNLKLYCEGGTLSTSTETLEKGAWTEYTVTVTATSSTINIGFGGNGASNSRFFLDEVKLNPVAAGAHNITVGDITGEGTISASVPSQTSGETVTVTANPGTGYELTALAYNGTAIDITSTPYTFTMPDADVTLTATFSKIEYNILRTITAQNPADEGGSLGNWTGCSTVGEANSATGYPVKATYGSTVGFKAANKQGYKVLAENVTVSAGDSNVPLTIVSSDDSGIVFSFEMPASDVSINAYFTWYVSDLYILGTANDNGWAGNVGVKMDYSSDTEKYTKTVYFAGTEANGDKPADPHGYFNFTERLGNADWSGMGTRYGAKAGDNYDLEANEYTGEMNWWDEHKENAFMVPAGIYTIEVNKSKTQVTVTPLHPTFTFTPAAGSTVYEGQEVTVSSNLYSLLHAINSTITESDVTNEVSLDGNTYSSSVAVTTSATTVTGKATYAFIQPTAEAEYTVNEIPAGVQYELVTSLDDLGEGVEYVIMNKAQGQGYAMSTVQRDNNRGQTALISVIDGKIIPTEDTQIVTLEAATDGGWYLKVGEGQYLYTLAGSNSLRTGDNLEATGQYYVANISIGETSHVATIAFATADNEKRYLRRNNSSDIFACYTSGQQEVYLYKKGVITPTVAMPTFNPAAGTYSSAQSVTISCATTGATIYYSTNGTDFQEYTEAITVSESTTLYAKATKDGVTSQVATAKYTITSSGTQVEKKTLAQIETLGTAAVGNTYTITDALVAVYANEDILWCKDQARSIAAFYNDDPETYIDYMQVYGDAAEAQQNNWVALKFTGATQAELDAVYRAVGSTIDAGTVTGKVIDGVNYTIEVSNMELTTTDGGNAAKNTYCPANFLQENLFGLATGHTETTSDKKYFFVNPKIQEVCEVTFAMWNGNYFVVPAANGISNDSEIPGAFNVDWKYNDLGNVSSSIAQNTVYRFNAVVQKPVSSPAVEGDAYVKVTSTDDLTDGDYIIVVEFEGQGRDYAFVFDGSLTTLDVAGNNLANPDPETGYNAGYDIVNNKIASTPEIDNAVFTITEMDNGYSIQSASGYYIGGKSGSNILQTSTSDPYINSISFDGDGNADIVCSSAHLRYNGDSTQDRFRYYKSGSYTDQKAIALYKKNVKANAPRLKAETPNSPMTDVEPDGSYMVYPLNFNPNDAENNIVTAINTVETGNGEVKSVKYVNVAGMVSDVPFQGVNIVVTEYSDGSRSTSKMLRK